MKIEKTYFNIVIKISYVIFFLFIIGILIDLSTLLIMDYTQDVLNLIIINIVVAGLWCYLIYKGIKSLNNIEVYNKKHYIISILLLTPLLILILVFILV